MSPLAGYPHRTFWSLLAVMCAGCTAAQTNNTAQFGDEQQSISNYSAVAASQRNNGSAVNNSDSEKQRQQAVSSYQSRLAEWKVAKDGLDSTRFLSDATQGMSAISPAPVDALSKLIRGLSPATTNLAVRSNETEVEVARQNLEVAKQQLINLGLNPLYIK